MQPETLRQDRDLGTYGTRWLVRLRGLLKREKEEKQTGDEALSM